MQQQEQRYKMMTMPVTREEKAELRVIAAKLGLTQAGLLRQATNFYVAAMAKEGRIRGELPHKDA